MGAHSNLHADLMALGLDLNELLATLPTCEHCQEPLAVIHVDVAARKLLCTCDNDCCNSAGTWWTDVPAPREIDKGG